MGEIFVKFGTAELTPTLVGVQTVLVLYPIFQKFPIQNLIKGPPFQILL